MKFCAEIYLTTLRKIRTLKIIKSWEVSLWKHSLWVIEKIYGEQSNRGPWELP